MQADKPILSKQAFWDVDMDKIDYQKNAAYVIEKVFQRGTFDDLIAVLNFYDEEKIKTSLLEQRYLSNTTTAFTCMLYNLKKEDFRCYRFKLLNPDVWPF